MQPYTKKNKQGQKVPYSRYKRAFSLSLFPDQFPIVDKRAAQLQMDRTNYMAALVLKDLEEHDPDAAQQFKDSYYKHLILKKDY
jgi:hypothetical protein